MTTLARFTLRQGLLLLIPLLITAALVGCGSPNEPEEDGEVYSVIGNYTTRGFPRDVAVNGSDLYVSENDFGITRLDISNPANPIVVQHLLTNLAPTRLRIAPWNNLLISVHRDGVQGIFLGDTMSVSNLIFGSGSVYDALLFPDTLTVTSSFDDESYFSVGTRVLRCDWNDGLHVTYVYPDSGLDNEGERDPNFHFFYEDPFEMSLYSTGARGVTSIDGFHTIAVAVGDIGVGIGETDEGVDGSCGRFISDIDTPGEAWELVHAEGYLYVADQVGGMCVIDVRNPLNPEFVTSWKLSGLDHAWNIDVQGDKLVLVDEYDGIFFFDISTPGSPVYKGNLEFEYTYAARFINDETVVVATKKEGLTFLTLNY
ncbi:hypothetical protein KQI63_14730 [bacterium]|nr:hypothetical protein [bacterium]